MAHKRFPVALILIFSVAALAQQITNGGWESGMTGWTTSVKPGVQATVTTIIEKRHSGGNALLVAISGSGIKDSLVRLTSNAYAWDTSRTYMLRFWAIAKDRAALVDLRIGEGASARKYHYEIYDSDGLWHRYQLLFKPAFTQGAITFQFGSPSTYWLDDVEVIDDRDTVLDLKTQFMWQSAHVGYGWISGDNDVSILLPDGRIAWILNDSFIGMLNDQSNVLKDVKMVTNLIIMEERKNPPVMSTVFAGTVAEPKALFPTTAFTLYWISDAMVVGDKLQILLQEWNWAYKFNNAAYVGTLSLPDLKVESMVKAAYKGTDIPNGILQEKDWTYIYSEDRSDSTMRYTRVARVPAGLITATSPWQFLGKDGTWSADFTKAGRMLDGVQIASAVKLGDSNYVFSGVRHLTNDLTVWFAKTPYGPWSAPYLVYRAPEEAGILPYLGHIHKGTRKDGVFTLSYSLFPNKGGWFQQLSDRGCYLPQYVKADLEKLSPYTKKTPTRVVRVREIGGRKARRAGFTLTGRQVQALR